MDHQKPSTSGLNLSLDLSGARKQKARYTNFRIQHSEPMGFLEFDKSKVGMPVIHSFESDPKQGSMSVQELVQHTRWPKGFKGTAPEKINSPTTYTLKTNALESSQSPSSYSFRDEHLTHTEFLRMARDQPLKPEHRQNRKGLSGGRRGRHKPMVFESKQLWMSDKGDVIPDSGFNIRKHIWYEGNRKDHGSGGQFEIYKMRVSKQPSEVSIDGHSSGPGGKHRSTHHLFVAMGPDNQYRSAKTRKDLLNTFKPGHK